MLPRQYAVGREEALRDCVRKSALARESFDGWWMTDMMRQVPSPSSGGRQEDQLTLYCTRRAVRTTRFFPSDFLVVELGGAAAVSLLDTPSELGHRSPGVARSFTMLMQHRCRSCVQEPN
jgi:hypothetical protein